MREETAAAKAEIENWKATAAHEAEWGQEQFDNWQRAETALANVREFLEELVQCDGSSSNVADAAVLAARIRAGATAQLAFLQARHQEIDQSKPWKFAYRNYRGETAIRQAVPISMRYGSTAYHHRPQWLLLGFDIEKQAEREYAMDDIIPIALGTKIATAEDIAK